MQDKMSSYSKDCIKSNQGSAMLIVIIIMTLIMIMSSIVLGYSLKSYKRTILLNDYVKAELTAESGINENLFDLLNRIDQVEVIESYTINNNSPYSFDNHYSYVTTISEDGFYSSSDFIVLGNVKTYRIKRSVETGEELTFDNIAIESIGQYKDATYTKRALITINTTTDDFFEINIYKCR